MQLIKQYQFVEAQRHNQKGCGFDSRWVVGIFIDLILSVTLWNRGSTQYLTKMSTRNILFV